ncbi:MAG: ribosome silencing factor [Pseudomonadota bacterium]
METILTPLTGSGPANPAPAPATTVTPAAAPAQTRAPISTLPVPDLTGLDAETYVKTLRDYLLARLEEEKTADITPISLDGKSEIADTMIIASGRSARHVSATADKILRSLKEAGLKEVKVEGKPACDWVLIDAGDVILHLFRPEVREFYNLERIWSEAARASVPTPGTDAAASEKTER